MIDVHAFILLLCLSLTATAVAESHAPMVKDLMRSHRVLPVTGVTIAGPATLPNDGTPFTYTITVTGTYNALGNFNFFWKVLDDDLIFDDSVNGGGFSANGPGAPGAAASVTIELTLWCLQNEVQGSGGSSGESVAEIYVQTDDNLFGPTKYSNVLSVTCVPPTPSPTGSPSPSPNEFPTSSPSTYLPSDLPSVSPSGSVN